MLRTSYETKETPVKVIPGRREWRKSDVPLALVEKFSRVRNISYSEASQLHWRSWHTNN